jgi:hypothetical protein
MEPVGEAKAVETEALGSVVATAEFDDVGAEFAQTTPLLGAGIGGEGAAGQGVAGGEPESQRVGEGATIFGLDWYRVARPPLRGPLLQWRRIHRRLGSGHVLGEVLGEGEGLLVVEPVAIAALLPFGEVLGADGFAAKGGGQDGLDLREGIEPGGEVLGLLAFVEAAAQLVPDLTWETGNFAGASSVHFGSVEG